MPSNASRPRFGSRPHPVCRVPLAAIALVVVAFVVLLVVDVAPRSTRPKGSGVQTGVTSLAPGVLVALESAPIGVSAHGTELVAPRSVRNDTPLRRSDKPEVVFVGAEYCPFCAAERWPLAIALMRFGHFYGLGATHSSAVDVDPDTATLSFYGARYASRYLAFSSTELESSVADGSSYAPLQRLTTEDRALLGGYDVAPYTSEPGSIPFLDLGNQYVAVGAEYDPELLAGKSQTAIARALLDPRSPVAGAVDPVADDLTAAMCQLTDGRPSSVCRAPGVRSATQSLARPGSSKGASAIGSS